MSMDRITPAAELRFQNVKGDYVVVDRDYKQVGCIVILKDKNDLIVNIELLEQNVTYEGREPIGSINEDSVKRIWDKIAKKYRGDYIGAIRAASMRDVFIKKSDNLTISEINKLPKLTDEDIRNIVKADSRAKQQDSTSTLEGMFDK